MLLTTTTPPPTTVNTKGKMPTNTTIPSLTLAVLLLVLLNVCNVFIPRQAASPVNITFNNGAVAVETATPGSVNVEPAHLPAAPLAADVSSGASADMHVMPGMVAVPGEQTQDAENADGDIMTPHMVPISPSVSTMPNRGTGGKAGVGYPRLSANDEEEDDSDDEDEDGAEDEDNAAEYEDDASEEDEDDAAEDDDEDPTTPIRAPIHAPSRFAPGIPIPAQPLPPPASLDALDSGYAPLAADDDDDDEDNSNDASEDGEEDGAENEDGDESTVPLRADYSVPAVPVMPALAPPKRIPGLPVSGSVGQSVEPEDAGGEDEDENEIEDEDENENEEETWEGN